MAVRIPPGPCGGQDLRSMRNAPLQFVTELAHTYGDLTRHEADGETVYLLNRPDLARHVLKENWTNYTKERTPDDAMLRPLLGDGLLTSSGEHWARQRRMCAPAFRRGEVLGFDAIIVEAATGLTARWRAAATAGRPVRVDHDLTALTLAVMVRAMLGADLGAIGEGFGRAVDAVNRFVGHYVPGVDADPADTARRRAEYLRAQAFLDTVVRTIVAARQAAGDAGRRDLLGAMLVAMHDQGEAAMSATELRDQVLTIVMAGHETTAKALTWTLYLLDQHPRVAARLREEVDAALGGRPPTAEDLPALPYCRAVLEESMRLYPPVWLISRRAAGTDEIDGYHVAAGTLVCISPWVLHRHPKYWDDVETFAPERFIPGQAADRPSHLYLPFGGGPRICVGQHFAMVEAVLVLAVIVASLRLATVPGFVVEPEALVTLRPRNGLVMTVKARN
jgi:enediyne biosynthesis protein E7